MAPLPSAVSPAPPGTAGPACEHPDPPPAASPPPIVPRGRGWIGPALRLALAAAALAYVVVDTDFTPMLAAAREPALPVGMALMLMAVPFQAWRWQRLLRAVDTVLPYGAALRFTWIGLFYNQCLPGAVSGDVMKAYYVVRHAPRRARVATSLVADRFVGLSAIVTLCAAVVLARWDRAAFHELRGPVLGTAAVLAALVALAGSARLRGVLGLAGLTAPPAADETACRAPPVRRARRGAALLSELVDAVRAYRTHRGEVLFAFLLSIGLQVGGLFMGPYFLLLALGHEGLPVADFLAVYAVIACLSAVPVLPSFLGIAVLGKWFWPLLGLEEGAAATLAGLQGAAMLVLALPGLALFLRARAFEGHDAAPRVPTEATAHD